MIEYYVGPFFVSDTYAMSTYLLISFYGDDDDDNDDNGRAPKVAITHFFTRVAFFVGPHSMMTSF